MNESVQTYADASNNSFTDRAFNVMTIEQQQAAKQLRNADHKRIIGEHYEGDAVPRLNGQPTMFIPGIGEVSQIM